MNTHTDTHIHHFYSYTVKKKIWMHGSTGHDSVEGCINGHWEACIHKNLVSHQRMRAMTSPKEWQNLSWKCIFQRKYPSRRTSETKTNVIQWCNSGSSCRWRCTHCTLTRSLINTQRYSTSDASAKTHWQHSIYKHTRATAVRNPVGQDFQQRNLTEEMRMRRADSQVH